MEDRVDNFANIKIENPDEGKVIKLEMEKQQLIKAVAGSDFSHQKTRVAYILNLFPQARNSDITLTLKYWEFFQPELFNKNHIRTKDLFKLERLHYIVRARAKIQNEYGLYLPDDEVRRHRRVKEEEMEDAVIDNIPMKRKVSVFSDETGKNQKYIIVASVWVMTGFATHSLQRAILNWKETSAWATREIHFNKFGKQDADTLRQYIDIIKLNREYLSFKAIAVERAKTRRNIEDTIKKLHEQMILSGTKHEIDEGRVALPFDLQVIVDEEQSLDPFALKDMTTVSEQRLHMIYDKQLTVCDITSISSRSSPLVQLADCIAGAINRRLNPQEDRNHKDEYADLIINELGLNLSEFDIPDFDTIALFSI